MTELTCLWCSSPFFAVLGGRGRRPSYCEDECKRLAKNAKSAEWRASDPRRVRTCRHCGAQWCNIVRPDGRGRKGRSDWCDSACMNAAQDGRDQFRVALGWSRKQPGRETAWRRGWDRQQWISYDERWAIYRRDDLTCWICQLPVNPDDFEVGVAKSGREYVVVGPSYPSLDHVVPRSLGGSDSAENLKTAHKHCNTKRGVDGSFLPEARQSAA